jgi:uncharacterized membrane protein YidH (DUF202 family)
MAKKTKKPKCPEPMDRATYLAEIRTDLANERTIMAYVRTSATLILFGTGFIGFANQWKPWKSFLYAGVFSVMVGVILLIIALRRAVLHTKKINQFSIALGNKGELR